MVDGLKTSILYIKNVFTTCLSIRLFTFEYCSLIPVTEEDRETFKDLESFTYSKPLEMETIICWKITSKGQKLDKLVLRYPDKKELTPVVNRP